MRHVLSIIPLLLLPPAMCGCLPEERIVWSPDAAGALVRGPDTLYLADADGKIQPILDARIAHVAWQDGARFLAVRVIEVGTWKDLCGYLSGPRRKRIELTAELLLAQLQAQKDKADPFEPMVQGDLLSALLYIRDTAWDRVPKSLREQAEKEGELLLKRPVHAFETYRLVDGKAERTAAIATTPDAMHAVRLSPDGKVLAYVSAKADAGEPETLVLNAMPVRAGAQPLPVAEGVAPSVAWSPRGDSVACCLGRTPEGSETALWTVCQARVRDAEGALLAKPDVSRQALALGRSVEVAYLPDGRVAFVSEQAGIPAPTTRRPRVNLFTLQVAQEKPQPVCATEQASALAPPQAMRLSPDGSRAALFGRDGSVQVVTLATGGVRDVLEPAKAKSATIPMWRNGGQLCVVLTDKSVVVVALPADPSQPAVRRVLSKAWPAPLVEFLVTGKRPEEPPLRSRPAGCRGLRPEAATTIRPDAGAPPPNDGARLPLRRIGHGVPGTAEGRY